MISAIILAAGQSKRMGQAKMLLPWGNVTVIERVISVFANAGVDNILVVTGGAREQVDVIVNRCADRFPVKSVFNKRYANDEMLSSIQCGLRKLITHDLQNKVSDASLIGLGDQPQIQERSVRLVMDEFIRTGSPLVAPSHQMRRGHPWLVAKPFWSELNGMDRNQTPRDFLNRHADTIKYVNVETRDILADLDTPEEYLSTRP